MNALQIVAVTNHIGAIRSDLVVGRSLTPMSKHGDKVFHGSFPKQPPPSIMVDSSEKAQESPQPTMVDSSEKAQKSPQPTMVEVLVFTGEINFYTPPNALGQSLGKTGELVEITLPLSWEGTLNAFDRLSATNPHLAEVETKHFSDSMLAANHFKNGIPINVGQLLKSQLDPSKIFKDQPEMYERWKIYQNCSLAERTHLDSRSYTDHEGRSSVLNFGRLYIHEMSFVNTHSTFPFTCGIKSNAINIEDPGEAHLFYSGFITTHNTGENRKDPSTEPEVRVSRKFGGPYHNHRWTSMYGGIPLNQNLFKNHVPIPLMGGVLPLPEGLFVPGAFKSRRRFFEKNKFFFIPESHHLFQYFTTLYRVFSEENSPMVKHQLLRQKNLSSLFWQYVKLPKKTPVAVALETATRTTVDGSEPMEIDLEQTLENVVNQETSSYGDGLVMCETDMLKVLKWFIDEYDGSNQSFTDPVSLDDVTFSLFRSGSYNNDWLTYNDQHKDPPLDINHVYSFKITISLICTVFPFGLSNDPHLVAIEDQPIRASQPKKG